MIQSLKPREREYFYGKLVLPKEDPDTFDEKSFRYEIVSYRDKMYNSQIKNLISSMENEVIRTGWDLGFEPDQQIILQNGDRAKISRCNKINLNQQAFNILRVENSLYWVIELVR